MILDGFDVQAVWNWLVRPLKWWFRKDRESDNLSYAMSIEAIPNPQGWITGAIISFFVECDVTGNNTEFERILNFADSEVIYTKALLDDEELREELAQRVKNKIDMEREARYAREVINMQVMIEGAVTWFFALLVAGVSLFITAGAFNGY